MEGELIIVSIISGVFSIAAISLLNRNWFKRQEMKYSFEKYKVRARSKNKPVPKTPAPQGPVEWLDRLKDINPDTLHTLVDTLTGGETEPGAEPAGLEDIIYKYANENPELVQGLISKFANREQGGGQVIR